MKQLDGLAESQTLALAIVETIREPFLVLDDELRVLAASRCYCEIFKEDENLTHGCSLFELGNGQWDAPGLRRLLETVVPERGRGVRVRSRLPAPRKADDAAQRAPDERPGRHPADGASGDQGHHVAAPRRG